MANQEPESVCFSNQSSIFLTEDQIISALLSEIPDIEEDQSSSLLSEQPSIQHSGNAIEDLSILLSNIDDKNEINSHNNDTISEMSNLVLSESVKQLESITTSQSDCRFTQAEKLIESAILIEELEESKIHLENELFSLKKDYQKEVDEFHDIKEKFVNIEDSFIGKEEIEGEYICKIQRLRENYICKLENFLGKFKKLKGNKTQITTNLLDLRKGIKDYIETTRVNFKEELVALEKLMEYGFSKQRKYFQDIILIYRKHRQRIIDRQGLLFNKIKNTKFEFDKTKSDILSIGRQADFSSEEVSLFIGRKMNTLRQEHSVAMSAVVNQMEEKMKLSELQNSEEVKRMECRLHKFEQNTKLQSTKIMTSLRSSCPSLSGDIPDTLDSLSGRLQSMNGKLGFIKSKSTGTRDRVQLLRYHNLMSKTCSELRTVKENFNSIYTLLDEHLDDFDEQCVVSLFDFKKLLKRHSQKIRDMMANITTHEQLSSTHRFRDMLSKMDHELQRIKVSHKQCKTELLSIVQGTNKYTSQTSDDILQHVRDYLLNVRNSNERTSLSIASSRADAEQTITQLRRDIENLEQGLGHMKECVDEQGIKAADMEAKINKLRNIALRPRTANLSSLVDKLRECNDYIKDSSIPDISIDNNELRNLIKGKVVDCMSEKNRIIAEQNSELAKAAREIEELKTLTIDMKTRFNEMIGTGELIFKHTPDDTDDRECVIM